MTKKLKVIVILPAFNAEKTLEQTVADIPKEIVSEIILVDDGSKDNTWNFIQKFKDEPQIQLFHKENGGKYTALNYGIANTDSELIGCLDADSFVDKTALLKIVSYFEDADTMAVTPAVKIFKPNNFLRILQENEYNMGIFNKKVLAQLDAINVTPGPFSFFRKQVFEKIGMFKHAHNTEDMEIAMRMQKNGFKIVNAHQAMVYTVGPATLYALYKQRQRWIYGYLKNLMDYRELIFSNKHGYLSFFFLPFSILMIFAAFYYAGTVIYNLVINIYQQFIHLQTVGFTWSWPRADLFFINTNSIVFLAILLVGLSITTIMVGIKISEQKWRFSWHMLYFPFVFPIASTLWLMKASYNVITSRKTTWR
jgi:cellulose synthase/poly-beta-1,6-N-acetylglucosamine synthase-like glycosyltransferase